MGEREGSSTSIRIRRHLRRAKPSTEVGLQGNELMEKGHKSARRYSMPLPPCRSHPETANKNRMEIRPWRGAHTRTTAPSHHSSSAATSMCAAARAITPVKAQTARGKQVKNKLQQVRVRGGWQGVNTMNAGTIAKLTRMRTSDIAQVDQTSQSPVRSYPLASSHAPMRRRRASSGHCTCRRTASWTAG